VITLAERLHRRTVLMHASRPGRPREISLKFRGSNRQPALLALHPTKYFGDNEGEEAGLHTTAVTSFAALNLGRKAKSVKRRGSGPSKRQSAQAIKQETLARARIGRSSECQTEEKPVDDGRHLQICPVPPPRLRVPR